MTHEDKLGEGAKKLKSSKDKVHAVMAEFKAGTLHSGSGEIVIDRKQALAIAMSEAGISKADNITEMDIEKMLSINDLAKSFETLNINQCVAAMRERTVIEKSFDTLNPLSVVRDGIEKALDTSKLIKKKVQIHSSSGKVYTGYRWVSQETGQPVKVKGEPKDIEEFKGKKEKETDEGKVDEEFASKIMEVVESNVPNHKKINSLLSLGVYDIQLILSLIPESNISRILYGAQKIGIDVSEFNDAIGEKVEAMSSDDVEALRKTPTYQLQEQMNVKDFDRYRKAAKLERRKVMGLSDDDIVDIKWDQAKLKLDGVLIDRTLKSLVMYGRGGVGKSYEMRQAIKRANKVEYDPELDLKSEEYDVVVKKGGSMTPVAMFKLMWKHNGKTIIFDDLDSMWDNQTMVDMLKGALEPEGDRTMTWEAKNPQKDEAGEPIPQSFRFKGSMIFISNKTRRQLSEIAAPIVDSRASAIDLSMSIDQTLKKIDSFKYQYEFRDADDNLVDISKEDIDSIMKFLNDWKDELRLEQINSRALGNLAITKKKLTELGKTSYKEFERRALSDMDLI